MVDSIDEALKHTSLNHEDSNYGLDWESIDSSHSAIRVRATRTYHNDFFRNLKQLKDAEKFCDIALKVKRDDKDKDTNNNNNDAVDLIKAHKLVLASASPYFRALFAGGFKECTHHVQELVIEQMSLATLNEIVDFMYTAEIVVRCGNVQALLPAAKMLQCEDVVNACCTFLQLNMDASNCICIDEFAKQYGCIELSARAVKYMTDHFCEIVMGDEFLQLSEQQLCKLLKRDNLSVRCESYVYRAVIDWVKHEPEKRRPKLDKLFQCVRFQYLPPKFLKEQIQNSELLKSHDSADSRQYLQHVCDELVAHKSFSCGVKPRLPDLCALFVVGGYQRQSIGLVECFRPSTRTWERCADMPTPRSGACCVTLALYIYTIGGRNNNLSGNVDCADVDYYDPFTNFWRSSVPLQTARSRAGAGVIDGLIYVAGGACGPKYHASVERYSMQEHKWEYVAPLSLPARLGLGCAVVNRLLYAIGGYDGERRLAEVEYYNPDENCWQQAASMRVARSGAGVCALNNFIYVVGGYTTNLQLNSVERFDVEANQWTFVQSLSVPRSALACICWNDRIYALGGYTGTEFLASVEVYDPKEDRWTSGGAHNTMSSERSGLCAAVTVEFIH